MNECAPALGESCPRCGYQMEPATVKTTIWRGESLCIVDDIPAQVCGSCHEQFYDEATSDALRRLVEENFASAQVIRELRVPVYSLAGRIAVRAALSSEDEIDADY